jgi:hypothetical protein
MFPGRGEMVGAHAIIKDNCQGNNGNPREVFKYRGFQVCRAPGPFCSSTAAEGTVGGVATEVVDASYHLREKSVVEVGVVGDLVDLFKGFGEAICFFKGGVYDCVVPNEVVDSGGFLSCQSLELSSELLPVPVVEESTRVDPLLLMETVQVSSDLGIVEDGF